jgi:hypothetical protein
MPTATTAHPKTNPETSPSKDASSTAAAREKLAKQAVKVGQPESVPTPERSADDLYDNIACTD